MKQETIFKSFMKYVPLNILGMIGLSCYILADTFFVSKGLGTNGLASLNLAISIYSFINGSGLMIGIGAATKYSILKAQNKHMDADNVFTTSIKLGTILGALFMLIGIFFSSPLSMLLGANTDTFSMANTYLKTILFFAPFFILNNVLLSFVRNDGNPKLSMSAMLLGSFSNIILDYIFIFPLQWGMFGAAFATGLAPIISIGLLSLHFINMKNNFHFKKCKIMSRLIINICELGISSLITEISSGIVLIIFNIVILRLKGNIGIAAYGIVANLSLVAMSIFTGISQGIQPLISNYYGVKNYHDLKKTFYYSIVLSLVISVSLYLITFISSDWLISLFNNEKNLTLAILAKQGLHIYFIGFFFAGINIITASFFSSVENPKKGLIISILRGFVAIVPVVLILSKLLEIYGVWCAFPCSETITFIVAVYYLKNHIRISKKSY